MEAPEDAALRTNSEARWRLVDLSLPMRYWKFECYGSIVRRWGRRTCDKLNESKLLRAAEDRHVEVPDRAATDGLKPRTKGGVFEEGDHIRRRWGAPKLSVSASVIRRVKS